MGTKINNFSKVYIWENQNKKNRLNLVNFKVHSEFFMKRSQKSEKNKIFFLQFLRALATKLLNDLYFFCGQYKLVITGKIFIL